MGLQVCDAKCSPQKQCLISSQHLLSEKKNLQMCLDKENQGRAWWYTSLIPTLGSRGRWITVSSGHHAAWSTWLVPGQGHIVRPSLTCLSFLPTTSSCARHCPGIIRNPQSYFVFFIDGVTRPYSYSVLGFGFNFFVTKCCYNECPHKLTLIHILDGFYP